MTATVQNRMVKTAFECFIEFAPERVTHPEVAFPLLPSFCPPYGQRPSIYRRPYLLPFLRQRPRRRSSVSLCLSCRSWSFSLLHFQFRRSFLRWERRLPPRPSFSARAFSPSPTRRAAFRIWLRVLPPASGTNSGVAVTPLAKPAANGVNRSNFRRFMGSFVL